MKIHLIFVIVSLVLAKTIADDQCLVCGWNSDVHCGKVADGSCVFTGLNRCHVERVSCRREEKKLKPFTEIVKGRCPKDIKKCVKL
ncbi:accessory gland protein Acp63F [Drosophila teissieri]|uniref:accessory gland protein Acp63F n=1 Tax=Drosophila teissieri TaxID=7243 RepID=UPI001CB9ED24|nr:accessory gland protein Acp63F [Drosophila teissieri]